MKKVHTLLMILNQMYPISDHKGAHGIILCSEHNHKLELCLRLGDTFQILHIDEEDFEKEPDSLANEIKLLLDNRV